MSFDFVGDSLVRHGHARPFDVAEGLELLAQAEEACLLQFAENVRRSPKFLCHCCSCCCDALVAARRFGFLHPVETTNFLPVVSAQDCRACGRCVEVCPVGAMELGEGDATSDVAARGADGGVPAECAPGSVAVDLDRCLGCGICVRACPYNAVELEPRQERVLTPVNSTQRLVTQAIETDTLPYLVFDEQDRSGHRALAAIVGAIAKLPPFKQALASRQLKSRYLERLCDRREWDY
jgi:ferredoxin